METYKNTEKCSMLKRAAILSKNFTARREFCRNYSRWHSDDADYELLIQTPKQHNDHTKSISSEFSALPAIISKKLLKVIATPKQTDQFKKLEFLGDAYLEFVVTVLLFEKFPNIQKKLLVELLRNIISNKNLADLSKKIGFLKDRNNLADDSKIRADVLEAYFGGVALESGLSTHFGKPTNNVWQAWNDTTKFMIEKSKEQISDHDDLFSLGTCNLSDEFSDFYDDAGDSTRRLTRFRNNRMKDLISLFNTKPDDFQRRFAAERLQLLGNSTLKYFLTKLYNDNLTYFSVKNLANLRDSRMKDSKINFLINGLLGKPSYSLFYSLFNKNKKKVGHKPNVAHIKQFLGYIVATHYTNSSNKKMHDLFQVGWKECESFVKTIYYEDMMKQCKIKSRRGKQSSTVGPHILY